MTLLTYRSKYVITSAVLVTTTLAALQDDTQASQTFSLTSSKTVLVIYQANTIRSNINYRGMNNAINIDGTDYARSWDVPLDTNECCRNTVFWVGTLAAGSHTIKGRFASNVAGYTSSVANRVLVILILSGDEYTYIDDATTATTTSAALVDDPNAQATVTPSGFCTILVLYNCSNSGATEVPQGKKAAINVGATDYGQAEKSNNALAVQDSVFTCYAATTTASPLTVKGRFASNNAGWTVTIHRRQMAILLFDGSTLIDTAVSTTQVNTSSTSLVDDAQATIIRITTDTRNVLVVCMGTKRSGTSSTIYGEQYGFRINANDRAASRGSPGDIDLANSCGTAYVEELSAGNHTIKGRFSVNFVPGVTARIDARFLIALWLALPRVGAGLHPSKVLPLILDE